MTRDDKSARRTAIESIVGTETVATQEQLRRILSAGGFEVSQSTLSRDIRRLGLVKRTAPDGTVGYTLPGAGPDRASRTLGRLLPELVVEATPAGNLLVVKTLIGAAQPVAAALDAAAWPEILGTVAGDDTVLVVLHSEQGASAVAERVHHLAEISHIR